MYNTTDIIAQTKATPGIPKKADVSVEAVNPQRMPHLAKICAAFVYVIGPRGSTFLGHVNHDGTLSRFTRV